VFGSAPKEPNLKKLMLFVVLAFFVSIPLRAEDNDRVSFANDVHIGQDDAAGDIVCFFCSVQMDGSSGDVVVFFGDVSMNGTSSDNVVFGGTLHVGDNGAVHDAVVMGGRLIGSPNSVFKGDKVVFPPIFLLLPILVAGLMIWAIVWLLRQLFGNRQKVVYVQAQR